MLNELEKAYLERFVEEDEMMDAVKKAIAVGYQELLPVVNNTDTDEKLGQRTRAFNTACELLDNVFKDMVKYKGRSKIINETNLER